MTAIILPKLRVTQPQQPGGIDWSNPITRGLVASINGATGLHDAVSGGQWTIGSGGQNDRRTVATKEGVGFDGDPYLYTGGGFTFRELTSLHLIPLKNQNFQYLAYLGDFPVFVYDGRLSVFTPSYEQVVMIGWDGPPTKTILRLRGLEFAAWSNGTEHRSSQLSTYTPSDNATVALGGGTNESAVNSVLHLFWNRALSDAEVASINANPWQVFTPSARAIYLPASGGQSPVLQCSVGAATAQGITTALLANQSVACAVGTGAAQGVAAAFSSAKSVQCSTGAANAQGVTVLASRTVSCGVGASEAQGIAAQLGGNLSVLCNVAQASAQGVSAQTGAAKAVFCGIGSSSAQGVAATVGAAQSVPCAVGGASTPGVAALIGGNASIVCGVAAASGQGAVALIGVSASAICAVANANAAGVTGAVSRALGCSVANASASGVGGSVPRSINCAVGNAPAQGVALLLSRSLVCGVGASVAQGVGAAFGAENFLYCGVASSFAQGVGAVVGNFTPVQEIPGQIHLPRLATRQPQQAGGINWANPITRGLVASQTGATGDYDAVDGQRWTLAYDTIKTKNTSQGVGLKGPARLRRTVTQPTRGYTFLALIGADVDSTIQDALTYCSNSFRSEKPNLKLNFVGGQFIYPGVMDGSSRIHCAVARHDGSTLNSWLNASGLQSIAASFCPNSSVLLMDWEVRLPFTGTSVLSLVWNRALSDAEIQSISANPWQVFASKPHALYFDYVLPLYANAGMVGATGVGAQINSSVSPGVGAAQAQGVTAQLECMGKVVCAMGASSAAGNTAQFKQTANLAPGNAGAMGLLAQFKQLAKNSPGESGAANALALINQTICAVYGGATAQGIAAQILAVVAVSARAGNAIADGQSILPSLFWPGESVANGVCSDVHFTRQETYPLAGHTQNYPHGPMAQTYPLENLI